MAATSVTDITELVDLDRYPIHDPDAPKAKMLFTAWANELELTGACNLQGFLTKKGARLLASEATSLQSVAYHRTWTTNFLFQSEAESSLPANHPARRFWTMSSTHLAADQFDGQSLLRRLYEWNAMIEFVARIQGQEKLYRFADEFQAINVIGLGEGQSTVCHHDDNECTVTLLLQAPENGGKFIFGEKTRTLSGDLDLDAIHRVMDGDPEVVRSLPRSDGTLTLFRGGCSMHGVTPVIGKRQRLTAIFTYDTDPHRVGTWETNISVYGPRVKEILKERTNGSSEKMLGQAT